MSEVRRGAAVALVYAAGLGQGLTIVAFPAAGDVLRRPDAFALGDREYGALFLPFFLGAIVASSAAGPLARRFGLRRLLCAGLLGNAAAMALFAAGALAVGRHAAGYAALLAAIGVLGLGFGAHLTALNVTAPRLFPRRAGVAITSLHAVIGVGTTLPPLLLPRFAAHGGWWWMPLSFALVLVALAGAALAVHLPSADGEGAAAVASTALPVAWARVAAFGAVAASYGICEAILGNWGVPYLRDERSLSSAGAGVALSLFWAGLTAGRVLAAVAARWVRPRRFYPLLPSLLGVALAIVSAPRFGSPLALFALAGLGCSAFLPLTINFAVESGPARSETVAGVVLACFMAGSALGGSGVGVLRETSGLPLAYLYRAAAGVAVVLALAAVALGRETAVARGETP